MKKITFSLAAIILLTLGVSSNAHAQYFSVALTGGVGIPTSGFGAAPTLDVVNGNIVGTASTGYGFELQGRYHFNPNWDLGLNIGYMNFSTQLFPNSKESGNFSVIPIMLAGDYYFITDKFQPFVGLEAGFMSSNVKYTSTPSVSASGSGFAFAPVIGAAYNFTDNFGLILNIKYVYGLTEHKFDISKSNSTTGSSDVGTPPTSYLAVDLGLNFTFGK